MHEQMKLADFSIGNRHVLACIESQAVEVRRKEGGGGGRCQHSISMTNGFPHPSRETTPCTRFPPARP